MSGYSLKLVEHGTKFVWLRIGGISGHLRGKSNAAVYRKVVDTEVKERATEWDGPFR